MSERSSKQPKLSEHTVAGKAARAERLAAEMRKNLMKRKRQQQEKTDLGSVEDRLDGDPDDPS